MDIPLGGRPKKNRGPLLIFVVMVILAAAFFYVGFRVGGKPTVSLTTDKSAIGKQTSVTVVVREPLRGLVNVSVALVQNDKSIQLAEETFAPQPAWWPWGPKTDESTLPLFVGKTHQPSLKEGTATIRIVATGAATWLYQARETVEERPLPVRLTPPALEVTAREIYVRQGGSEAVTYTVGPTSVRDGVQAGDWFFPGYPHPNGQADARVALFAIPYDMSSVEGVVLTAEDDVGNKASVPFIENFKAKPYSKDTINVSKRVMEKVVPKIRARTPELEDKGNLLDNYILINRDLRKVNNARLVEIAKQTQPRFLWTEPFVQMPAKVVSSFADRRTYRFQGKEIDRQDHLGFDLASVRRAEIPAANHGIVVMSEYLGIYGNTVVIDHGLGLMSLYAHCSSVSVNVGDGVKRGQTIGRTGATGLALGDHLHFTMMLSGLPVTPLEWWDGHWIRDRIARKLPSVFSDDKD